MQINSKKDLVNMIAKRDHVTIPEAKHMVNVTQQLIDECFADVHSYAEIEDILLEYLGIELDYIYLFI